MIIAVTYVIISFLLDGIVSNLIPFNLVDPSYFKTIYSVISLVIIYNYFDNHQKYLTILIILGIFFDIIYTNTFILNIIVFLMVVVLFVLIIKHIMAIHLLWKTYLYSLIKMKIIIFI